MLSINLSVIKKEVNNESKMILSFSVSNPMRSGLFLQVVLKFNAGRVFHAHPTD